MNVKQYIHKKIEELFNKFRVSSMSATELIENLRGESNGSSILFYLLLEQLLIFSFSKKYIILSKGLLKHYLKSEYKESPDYIYIGGNTEEEDENVIKTAHGIVIKKGIFIKIIEKLNLKESLNAYVKFLIINEEEINEKHYLSETEIKKYSDINYIVEVMYKEFDKKIDDGKKIINFK